MKNEKTYSLVLTALFTAIIVIMAYTPLGFIPLGIINATIIHIPVILGALFLGPKKGGFLGFVFGLTSFLKNTLTPATLSAFVFSPVLAASQFGAAGAVKSAIICFVPRILVGVIPYFVFVGVRKLASGDNKAGRIVACIAAGLVMFFFGRAFSMRTVTTLSPVAATIIGVVLGVLICAILYFVTIKKSAASLGFVYAGLTGAFTNTILVMGGIYVFYKDSYAAATNVAVDKVLSVIMGVVTFNGVVESVVAAVIVAALGLVLMKVKTLYCDEDREAVSAQKTKAAA